MHLSKRVCEYTLVNVSFNVIWMKRSRNVSVWPLIHVCLYVSEPPWLHFRHEARRQRTIHRPIQPIARPLLETVGLTPRLVAPGATIVTLFGVSTASWKNDSGPWLWMLNTHTHTLRKSVCLWITVMCVWYTLKPLPFRKQFGSWDHDACFSCWEQELFRGMLSW